MRKHFLILMLLALLPFTAWASITWEIAPAAATNLTYNGSARELLSPIGTPSGGADATYCVTLKGAAQPTSGYTALGYTATNAAEYTVWVKVGDQVEPYDAIIAPSTIDSDNITIHLTASSAAITSTDYTGADIATVVKVNDAALGTDDLATWSSDIKNAGSYTVTVQKREKVDEVYYVNQVGTKDFLVNKIPLYVNAKHMTITYGDAAVENNALYTATGWAGTDATNPEVNNLVVNVNFGGLQPTNAGVHPFTITAGTVNNYNVIVSVANANLTIEKKELTIQAKAGAGFEYGEVTSYAPEFVYTGLLPKDANSDGSPKDGVLKSPVTFTALTADTEPVNFFNTDGSIKGNAGTYVITPVVEAVAGVQSDNYELDCKATNGTTYSHLVVAPKSLKHSHVTISPIPDQEYANATLTPVIKITDSKVYGSEPKELNPGTDYTVTWSSTPLKAAGTYTATFGAGSNGNYTVPSTAPTKTFKINPAPLTIVIKDQTKPFDNKEFFFTDDGTSTGTVVYEKFVDIYGVKASEALSTVFTAAPVLTYAAKGDPESKVNVNSYEITVTSASATSSNYDVYVEPGTLTIDKMPIWIKAKDTKKVYGKTDPALTYVVLPAADALETAALTPNDTYIATDPTFVREGGEDVDTYAITMATEAVVKDNYELKGYVDGTFTIELATLRIVANNKSQEYNGEVSETLDYNVYGLVDGDEVTGVTVTKAETPTTGTGTGADAGVYAITPAGASVKNKTTGADAKGNYKAIVYQQGTYTITQKKLTVTALPQGLLIGEKETDLDPSLVEFGGLIDADKGRVNATLKFSANVQVYGAGDPNEGKIKNTEDWTGAGFPEGGIVVEGIEVKAIGGEKADNYYTSVTTPAPESYLIAGNLLITTATETLVLNLNYADKATWDALDDATKAHNSTVIEAAKNKKARVTFDDFEMKAEKWYPMVLPFKTSVAELSQAFGYAVVNILNKDNTDDAIRFKLHMQEIEANQPFLIKIASDKVLANGDNNVDANEVWFTNKTIASQNYSEDENMNTHIKFVGFYDAKIGVTAHDFWFSHLDGWNARYGGADDATRYLRPLNAFVHTPDGSIAKVIYVEDPNSGVTAIQAISAEGAEAIPVQGWYTVNGVKLQGVPTEKGIYINNGKKIVIK